MLARARCRPHRRRGAAKRRRIENLAAVRGRGSAARPSVGERELASVAKTRRRIIRIAHGADFRQRDASSFMIRAGNP
jgi:hypothetical protein